MESSEHSALLFPRLGELIDKSTYLQKTINDNNLYALRKFSTASGTNKGYIFKTNLSIEKYQSINIEIHTGQTNNNVHNFKMESNVRIWDYVIVEHNTIAFGVSTLSPQYMVVFVDSENTISIYLHITSNVFGGAFKAAIFDLNGINRIIDISAQTSEYQIGSHEKELKVLFTNYK